MKFLECVLFLTCLQQTATGIMIHGGKSNTFNFRVHSSSRPTRSEANEEDSDVAEAAGHQRDRRSLVNLADIFQRAYSDPGLEGDVIFSARRFCRMTFGFDYGVLRGMADYRAILQLYKLSVEDDQQQQDSGQDTAPSPVTSVRHNDARGTQSANRRRHRRQDAEASLRPSREIEHVQRRRRRQRQRQRVGGQGGRGGARRSGGGQRSAQPQSRVSIYQVLPNISGQHSTLRLLDSRLVDVSSRGWVYLDVTPALRDWSHNAATNHGLEVWVESAATGTHSVRNARLTNFVRPFAKPLRKQPELVVSFN